MYNIGMYIKPLPDNRVSFNDFVLAFDRFFEALHGATKATIKLKNSIYVNWYFGHILRYSNAHRQI